MIKVTETGTKETISKLNAIKTGLVPEIGSEMEFIGMPIYSATASYPSEVPGTDYERTYNYLNSLQVKSGYSGGVGKWELTQGTSYWQYLRDPDDQAPWHKGRWETVPRIVERLTSVVVARVVAVVEAFIRRIWGS
jgi:hypothetical protein